MKVSTLSLLCIAALGLIVLACNGSNKALDQAGWEEAVQNFYRGIPVF